MNLHEKHMEIVDAINNSETDKEHWHHEGRRTGFLEAVEILRGRSGCILMDADLEQMDRGIDRPMCGGVFLDWKPKE